MPFTLSPEPWFQFLDANGVPYAGGKLYTYEAGTVTKATTYTDADGNVPQTNPIILDAQGCCTIFLPTNPSQRFKYVLHDRNDVPVRTQDNVYLELSGIPGGPAQPGLNADFLDGLDSTDFLRKPASGAAVVPFLNADLLDGHDSSEFALIGAPGTPAITNLNADLLDGIDSTGFLQKPVSGAAVIPFLNADLIDGFDSTRFVWNTITTAQTGVVNDWNPNSALVPGQPTEVRWVGPAGSTLTITGIFSGVPGPGPVAGQLLVIRNFTPGAIVELIHQSASSGQFSRLGNMAHSGPTCLTEAGVAIYLYDPGGYWLLIAHDQGAWITIPHNPANYLSLNQGTWQVPPQTSSGGTGAGVKYLLKGKTIFIQVSLGNTLPVGSSTYLAIVGWPYTLVGGEPLQTAVIFTTDAPRWTGITVSGGASGLVFVKADLDYWHQVTTNVNGTYQAHVS